MHSDDNYTAIRQRLALFGFDRIQGVMGHKIKEIACWYSALDWSGIDDRDAECTGRKTHFNLLHGDAFLQELVNDSTLKGILSALCGADRIIVGIDAVSFVGPSYWHCDNFFPSQALLKFCIYLDALECDSGALRIIPGSHESNSVFQVRSDALMNHVTALGLQGPDVPACAIPSRPGDLLVFNPNAYHSAWAPAGKRRRQLSLLVARSPVTDLEKDDLKRQILIRHARSTVSLGSY